MDHMLDEVFFLLEMEEEYERRIVIIKVSANEKKIVNF